MRVGVPVGTLIAGQLALGALTGAFGLACGLALRNLPTAVGTVLLIALVLPIIFSKKSLNRVIQFLPYGELSAAASALGSSPANAGTRLGAHRRSRAARLDRADRNDRADAADQARRMTHLIGQTSTEVASRGLVPGARLTAHAGVADRGRQDILRRQRAARGPATRPRSWTIGFRPPVKRWPPDALFTSPIFASPVAPGCGNGSISGFTPSFAHRDYSRRTSTWGQVIEHGPRPTLYVIGLASDHDVDLSIRVRPHVPRDIAAVCSPDRKIQQQRGPVWPRRGGARPSCALTQPGATYFEQNTVAVT